MSTAPTKSPQRLNPLWEGRRLLVITGLFLTFLGALLLVSRPRFVQQAQLHLYDAWLREAAIPPKSSVPVMVGIDELSLDAYGQWPWPRYRLALLVQRLQEMGAEVVALDFLMPEPDRSSPEVIRSERERDMGTPQGDDHPAQRDSNSQRLASVLAGGNTVLGYYFQFGNGAGAAQGSATAPPGLAVQTSTAAPPAWPKPSGILRSMPVLTTAARSEGFTNAQHDVDGVLRRVPLLLHYGDNYYPSFALGALLSSSPHRKLRLVGTGSATELHWGGLPIPVDDSGNLLINFRHSGKDFPYISAKEILRGAATEGSLRGKIVVVGAWAAGLGDIHQTPSGLPLKGLEVHATIIDNILSGTFIARPGWAAGAELFALLLLGGLSTWLLSQSGACRFTSNGCCKHSGVLPGGESAAAKLGYLSVTGDAHGDPNRRPGCPQPA